MHEQQQMILDSGPRARQVTNVPVAEEMSSSFLAYSLSVITSRAIPDVRDGLKPVQRRILWAMFQMGVRPGTPFRKSARIVGETMGRYHPHGDAAIYDALVRLGQDFSRRVALVDPQGNFGSLDDPPAASRYTECRLSKAAMDLVAEVTEDTVDYQPTYDGEGVEPSVFPATFPNLLVNGTSGIAVGMATNMAPHNLGEIGAAVELVLRNQARGKTVTTDELLKVVPGPDFPGGGRVVDQGLRQVYESGRGPVRMQARVEVKRLTRLRDAIVVTELPYQVGVENVISKITKLVESGRLADVAGVVDLTDIEGLNIQIKLKPGADARATLAALYRLTPLEESFHVNNVVLVDGVPTTFGLRQLCEHYIKHRLDVIVRRTRHRRREARSKLEIVDGLIIALDHIDEVVELIRESQTPEEAHGQLVARLGLSDRQASHVLNMQLRRLTALERRKLIDEAESLRKAITDYEQILAGERRRRQIVRDELRKVVKDHNTSRRSEIVSDFEADDLLADLESGTTAAAGPGDEKNIEATGTGGRGPKPGSTGSSAEVRGRDTACVVTMSTSGNLGRAPVSEVRRASPGRHDLLADRVITSTASPMALVTSEGRAFVINAGEAADASNRLRGAPVAPMLGLTKTERVLALVTANSGPLIVVTAGGMVRRVSVDAVLSAQYGDPVIRLAPEDQVVVAFVVDSGADLVIVADDAKALRVPLSDFSPKSRNTSGVVGMKLRSGAQVVGAGVANAASVADPSGAGVADAASIADPSGAGVVDPSGAGVVDPSGEGVANAASVADPSGEGVANAASVADPSGAVADAESVVDSSGEGVVVVATTSGGLKATWCYELGSQRRGGKGLFIAKLAQGDNVSAVSVLAPSRPRIFSHAKALSHTGISSRAEAPSQVGILPSHTEPTFNPDSDESKSGAGWLANIKLMAIKAKDDNPRRMDPHPVTVRVEPTKRYTSPKYHDRRIWLLAPARW